MRRLLKLEELYSSPLSKQIPIDVEGTQLGRDATALLAALVELPEKSTAEVDEPISPYCDMSFRLLSRLADALMQKHECDSHEVDSVATAVEDLFEFQKRLYHKRIVYEKRYFVDKSQYFHARLDKHEKKELFA